MYLEDDPGDMATNEEVDATRTRVQTYVPAYQKERWQEEADELGMSLSEFVKTMVQAGRSDFGFDGSPTDDATHEDESATPSSTSDPQGSGLEDRVESVLSEEGHCDWDELLAAVTDDVEARLDETLEEMQDRNEIRYSGRHGGYTLA